MSPRTYSASPSPDAPLATWAVWYAAQGIPVFPCKGKVPATPKGFYDATCDPFRVEMWWRNMPSANIATPTGKDYWVVDCDPRNGGESTWAALVQRYSAPLPTALCLTGGGGTHQYYQLPDEGSVRHHSAALGTGLDVQAVGGYVILPPSIHPDTGKAYAWDLGSDLESPGICEAPGWLLALVTQAGEENAQGGAGRPTTDPGEPIPLGVREATLVRIGSAMRHAGGCYAEILAALAEAAARCDPPMLEKDYTRIAKSVTRYDVDPVFEAGGEKPETLSWGSASTSSDFQPHFIDTADLLLRDYPLPQWIIKGLIPEGLTFFAGSPKSSKTYLAYSLALSLAFQGLRNGLWLDHYDINMPGPVVYITLEDDEADSKQRMLELMPELATVARDRFIFHHGVDLPQLGQGLTEWLERAVVPVYHPALIVLDPISYLYAPQKKSADQFTEVRTMLLPLRTMARKYHLSVIGVDHRRKKSADDVDVFETLYGSNAKIAIADSLLIIVREEKEIMIHVKVRKGPDQTLTLGFQFDSDGGAHWDFKGSTDGLVSQGQYGDLRQKVVNTLSLANQPLSISDLMQELALPDSRAMRHNLAQILYRMVKTGEVQKTNKNAYVYVGSSGYQAGGI